jgi:hypothetical protein
MDRIVIYFTPSMYMVTVIQVTGEGDVIWLSGHLIIWLSEKLRRPWWGRLGRRYNG